MNCIEIANEYKFKKGLGINRPNDSDIDTIKHFSELWFKYGLSEYNTEPGQRNFSTQEKFECLKRWSQNLFPPELIDINYLHRKVLNSESSIIFETQSSYLSDTSFVLYNFNDKTLKVNCIDLVPFEIDNLVQDINNLKQSDISHIKFNEYIETAEKNLSYSNDSADEIALKYYKMALEINPTDVEVKQQYETLDKIANHKNYNYPINDQQTIELMKVFVDSCNVKEFERLYKIIADDFVCISRYFGRTKKAFIDSVFSERKSMMGLWTEIFQYANSDRQIPCIKLNDYGVLFLNIENDKIIRAFEYKIESNFDRNKLTKWKE
jgi:hypothetical protein